MPSRPLAPVRASLARALAGALALAPACGGGSEEPALTRLPPREGAAAGEGHAEAARAVADALLAEPTPAKLLAALAQGHAVARALTGPHTLKYTAEFSLKPEAPARPVVDQPVLLDQAVRDELLLEWASAPGGPVQFHLAQSNDKERGREVVVLDEQVFTRLPHRGWHARALDSELHWRWLDEAQRAVHDVVALAAPQLAVAVVESGDALQITLSLAPQVDAALSPAGPGRAWRQQASITAIEGAITVERATGLWRTAEIRVRYDLKDAQDRLLRGETHLTGTVAPTPDLQLRPPELAGPLPERTRYEVERRRLLDGLAGT